MEQLISQLLSEPLSIVIVLCLLIAVVFAVIRKVLKLLLYAFVGLLAFLAYQAYTGQSKNGPVSSPVQELMNSR